MKEVRSADFEIQFFRNCRKGKVYHLSGFPVNFSPVMSSVFVFLLLVQSSVMGFTIKTNLTSGEEDPQNLLESDLNNSTNFTTEPQGLEEANDTSSPVRRDVAVLIPPFNEYPETDNIYQPWNYDIYDQNSIHNPNNVDYFNFVESPDNKNSTWPVFVDLYKSLGFRFEPPQKVYFHGPPSLQNSDNIKWNNGYESNPKVVSRRTKFANDMKPSDKSICKRYLQFLKYAFENLDDMYDDNEYYTDDYETPGIILKNQGPFSTQMFGPTVFVDNSAKVMPFFSNAHDLQNENLPFENFRVQSNGRMREPWNTASLLPSSFSPRTSQKSNPETPVTSYNDVPYDSLWSNAQKVNTQQQPITTVEPPSLKTDSYNQQANEDYSSSSRYQNKWEKKYNRTSLYTDHESYSYNRDNSLEKGRNDKTTVSPIAMPTVTPPPEDNSNNFQMYTEKYPTGSVISSTTIIDFGVHYSDMFSSTVTPDNKISEARDDDSKIPDCEDKLPCPETLNITYPLNGYCNIYVSCEAGKAIRRVCPEGLHYNIITKGCDLPHNSFCNYACPVADGYFGVPGDCEGYFKCKNFHPEYKMCPPKMHWDIEKNICVFAEVSSCPMKCTKINEIKPYEGSCSSYITCFNDVPLYHSCPPNKIFDPILLECASNKYSYCQDDPRLLRKGRSLNRYCKEYKK